MKLINSLFKEEKLTNFSLIKANKYYYIKYNIILDFTDFRVNTVKFQS